MNRYVGAEIDGDSIYLMADTPYGLLESETPTGRDCSLEQLKQAVETFVGKLPYKPSGIGMGMPGLVADRDKVELSHVVPALTGATAEVFAAVAGAPVAFVNDVKAAAMAEAARYADRDTVIVVLVDAFIAAGVVVKGELLRGAKGWGGELGYMLVTVDGKPQLLDSLASGYAILNRAGLDDAALRKRLGAGDERVAGEVREAGTYFGYALTNLVHLYNPDVIVVGGRTPTYEGYMDAAKAALQEHALPELLACCTIASPAIAKRVIAYGAREWIRQVFPE